MTADTAPSPARRSPWSRAPGSPSTRPSSPSPTERERDMTSNRWMAAVLCGLAGNAPTARAEDYWDRIVNGDNACATTNAELVHGGGQTHDLQGTAPTFDVDWARIQ